MSDEPNDRGTNSRLNEILGYIESMAENDEIVNQDDLQKLKFESEKRRYRNYRKRAECVFGKCTKNSVKSHSIQKSRSLLAISVNSHVLHPQFNHKSVLQPEMVMERIGINDASTFLGFCEDHERLFSEFEKNGIISTPEHVFLQSYRNICREISHCVNDIDTLEYDVGRYKEIRNQKALDIFKIFILNMHADQSPEPVSLKIECNDRFISIADIGIPKLKQKLTILEKYKKYLYNKILNDKGDIDIYYRGLNIDLEFPVCLCGIGSVGIVDGNVPRTVFCIMNIIPTENNTSISIAGLIEDESILQPYWQYYTQNNISILNMVESFMIHGSDHWYINPSVWNILDTNRQTTILNDILATEKSFLDQFDLSIFDDLRKLLITKLENQQKRIWQKNIDGLIALEKKKFDLANHTTTRTTAQAVIDHLKRSIL